MGSRVTPPFCPPDKGTPPLLPLLPPFTREQGTQTRDCMGQGTPHLHPCSHSHVNGGPHRRGDALPFCPCPHLHTKGHGISPPPTPPNRHRQVTPLHTHPHP